MSDPFAADTILLLPFYFLLPWKDFSAMGRAMTATAGITSTSVISRDTRATALCNGSSGYLTAPTSTDFAFGTGDWTIEGWIYPTGSGSALLQNLSSVNLLHALYIDSPGTSGRVLIAGSETITGVVLTLSTWQHVAVVRSGTSIKAYVNGTQSGTTYTIGAGTSVGASTVNTLCGNAIYSAHCFHGNVSDIRVTRAARYTGSFTPPTSIVDLSALTATARRAASGRRPDIVDGGMSHIANTASRLGVPGRYRVRLFERRTGRCLRETWSDAAGAYAFANLAYRDNGYFLVAFDDSGDRVNAAISDLWTPDPMVLT
jgi:hypothetical protein